MGRSMTFKATKQLDSGIRHSINQRVGALNESAVNPTRVGLTLAMCFVVVLSSGCMMAGFNGILGSGVVATESRDTDAFHSVDISGSANTTIQCGEENSVSITIDDNLVDIIETSVSDETLDISSTESYSTKLGLKADVSLDQLQELNISGAADANIIDCDTDKITLSISGAAKVTASGIVDTIEIEVSGAAKLDLSNLIAKKVKLEMSGASKATVHATEELDVELSGVGKVRYAGDAVVTKSISGMGSVKKIEE
jgi:hypothetical protein